MDHKPKKNLDLFSALEKEKMLEIREEFAKHGDTLVLFVIQTLD
jgi:hypothetical protein